MSGPLLPRPLPPIHLPLRSAAVVAVVAEVCEGEGVFVAGVRSGAVVEALREAEAVCR